MILKNLILSTHLKRDWKSYGKLIVIFLHMDYIIFKHIVTYFIII